MGFFNDALWEGDLIGRFIIQLMLVVILSRVLHFFLSKIREPMVISEMIAGILLGFTDQIFPASSKPALKLVATVGLLFFMFIVGMEVDSSLFRKNIKHSAVISICGIAVPFGIGCLIALLLYDYEDASVSFGSYLLFIGVAMSITAFPVLARILVDQDLSITKVGVMTLSSAAVDDVVAWVFLALTVAIVRAENYLNALWTALTAVGYIILMLLTKLCLLVIFRKFNLHKSNSPMLTAVILVGMFGSAWLTLEIGIHEIFGAFVFGLVVPREHNYAHRLSKKIEDLVVVFFLPLYFTYAGLGVDIFKLDSAASWGIVLLIIFSACVGKVIGCFTPAKFLARMGFREALAIGILMNTKGLVELIVLNIGYDLKVINQATYTMMVLMALCTTFMTTPIISFVYPRKQIMIYERANFDKGKEFSILLCLSSRLEASRMIALANDWLLRHPKNRVYALNLMEADDRPSTYLKEWEREQSGEKDKDNHNAVNDDDDNDKADRNPRTGVFGTMYELIRKMFSAISGHQSRAVDQDDPIAVTVNESSKIIGKKISLIKKASNNMKQDLCTVALARRVDMVILGEGHRLPSSVSGKEKRERIFGGHITSYVLDHAKSTNVAILVRGYKRGKEQQHQMLEDEGGGEDVAEMLMSASLSSLPALTAVDDDNNNNTSKSTSTKREKQSPSVTGHVLLFYYGGAHDALVIRLARQMTADKKNPVGVTIVYVKTEPGKRKQSKVKKTLTWVKDRVTPGGRRKRALSSKAARPDGVEGSTEEQGDDVELDEMTSQSAVGTDVKGEAQSHATAGDETSSTPSSKGKGKNEEDLTDLDISTDEELKEEDVTNSSLQLPSTEPANEFVEPDDASVRSESTATGRFSALRRRKPMWAGIDDMLLVEALKRPNVSLVTVEAGGDVLDALSKELVSKTFNLIVTGVGKEMPNKELIERLLETTPADSLLFVRQAFREEEDIV